MKMFKSVLILFFLLITPCYGDIYTTSTDSANFGFPYVVRGSRGWDDNLNNAIQSIDTAILNSGEAENIIKHGAIADDGIDDSSAIQNAITAAGSGGSVFIPKGTYSIESTISITSPVTIYGEGWKSILQATDAITQGILVYNTTDVTLRDFAYDANYAGGGISLYTLTRGNIIRVYVHDIADPIANTRHCIEVKGNNSGILIMGCKVENSVDDGIAIGAGGSGNITTDVRVIGNTCYMHRMRVAGVGPSGIEVDDSAKGITILGNIVKSTQTPCIDLHVHDGANGIENCNITGNYCEGGNYGIGVHIVSGTPNKYHRNINITGNTIRDCATGGINVEGAIDVVVSGNTIYGCIDGIVINKVTNILVESNGIGTYKTSELPSSYVSSDIPSGTNSTSVGEGENFTEGERVRIWDDSNNESIVIAYITDDSIEFVTNAVNSYTTAANCRLIKDDMDYGIRLTSNNDYVKLIGNSIRQAKTSNYLYTATPTHLVNWETYDTGVKLPTVNFPIVSGVSTDGVLMLGARGETYNGTIGLDFNEQYYSCAVSSDSTGSGTNILFKTGITMNNDIRQIFGGASNMAWEWDTGPNPDELALWSTNVDGSGTNGNVFTVKSGENTANFYGVVTADSVSVDGVSLVDGITAPSTLIGYAVIYVDSSDGDLKVKFSDGTVKVIAADS